jgi:hypothetical protein
MQKYECWHMLAHAGISCDMLSDLSENNIESLLDVKLPRRTPGASD